MPTSLKYLATFGLTIPSSIVILWHAYLGSFTRLIADDYCSYYNTETLGVLGTAWFWYRTWTGVYARSALNEILLLVGPYNMEVIVPGVLLVWLVTTAAAIHLLLGKEFGPGDRRWMSISFSAVFLFAILLLSPRLTQSLYWWGGLSAYTFPLVLTTIFLILFLVVSRRAWSQRGMIAWGSLSFVLAFGLGGISESFTPILLVIIALALAWKWLKKHEIGFWFLGSALVGAMLALAIMISAPGNAIRQANFPPTPGLGEIFRIATVGYFEFLASLFAGVPKSAGLVGALLGAMTMGIHARQERPPRAWTIPAALFVGMSLAYLCFPPTAYGMSSVPPARVLIVSVFFLAAGLMGCGYLAGKWISARATERHRRVVTTAPLLAAILLLSFSSWATSRHLYESRQTFIEFARLWDEVDAQILQAKANGQESVNIPVLGSWTGLDRPNDNPKFWATRCYSDFYGIQVYGPPYGP